jgi:hypothetical protein
LRCSIRSLIWDLSDFLIYALMAINFPLRIRLFLRQVSLWRGSLPWTHANSYSISTVLGSQACDTMPTAFFLSFFMSLTPLRNTSQVFSWLSLHWKSLDVLHRIRLGSGFW